MKGDAVNGARLKMARKLATRADFFDVLSEDGSRTLLANVYLHYVFDLWGHRWRLTKAPGEFHWDLSTQCVRVGFVQRGWQ
jgi:hypothetical protein